MAMLITFVNFQVMRSSEHLASHITFVAVNAYILIDYLRRTLKADQIAAIMNLALKFTFLAFLGVFLYLTLSGTTRISGRVMTLIDPSYASSHMPLIASVAEHSPTMWMSYFRDLNMLIIFVPIGFYYALVHKLTHGTLFVAMYAVFTVYFSCVMNRLMLVLAPAVCILAAIAVSHLVGKSAKAIRLKFIASPSSKPKRRLPIDQSLLLILLVTFCLKTYIFHSTDVTARWYSSPSFISDFGKQKHGDRVIIDDFRETYYWLKQNTASDAKILAWWDYGYQIAGMSNRTVIVDNNTWNNTHIATVGKVLISDEDEGYEVAKKLDANYVMVHFGGYVGNPSDDYSKFLWFVRIANSVWPEIEETDYYGPDGRFMVDSISETMKNSLCYKMMFYRFGEVLMYDNYPTGWDRARDKEIGHKDISFTKFREVYTSDNWMIRVYEVLEPENRGP